MVVKPTAFGYAGFPGIVPPEDYIPPSASTSQIEKINQRKIKKSSADRAAAAKRAQKKRLVIPTSAKEFACDYTGCVCAFAQKDQLSRHQRTHLRITRCGGCQRQFSRLDAALRHTRLCSVPGAAVKIIAVNHDETSLESPSLPEAANDHLFSLLTPSAEPVITNTYNHFSTGYYASPSQSMFPLHEAVSQSPVYFPSSFPSPTFEPLFQSQPSPLPVDYSVEMQQQDLFFAECGLLSSIFDNSTSYFWNTLLSRNMLPQEPHIPWHQANVRDRV